jgi:hypothetical protein
MTDTHAESAEAPRTPEEWAAKTIHYGRPCPGPEGGMWGPGLGLCAFCQALAEDYRAALAALNAQWKEALLQYEGCAYWIAAEQHSCAKCAPLRALLAEGKPGK